MLDAVDAARSVNDRSGIVAWTVIQIVLKYHRLIISESFEKFHIFVKCVVYEFSNYAMQWTCHGGP